LVRILRGAAQRRALRIFDRPGLQNVAPNCMTPVYDARKLEALLGPPQMTAYERGIGETLDWIATRPH
jgi:hypothetical protein